jgi:o-succinylbenzoate synthase
MEAQWSIPSMEDIFVHRYTLKSGTALNAVSVRREFPGALLHIGDGFAAVHPWTEFGDAPLEDQLSILAQGGSTPLLERALHMAAVDGAARRAGVSLFQDLHVPPSHYSWSMAQPVMPQIDLLKRSGFDTVKLKGLANYGETKGFMESLAKAMPELRLRVDFNGCLDARTFGKFVEFLPLRVYRQLDLIEDPCPYSAEVWDHARSRWGVRLALDKGWRAGTTGFDAVVVKPARRDWRIVAEKHPGVPLMLTSAMDHPLSQSYAAYEAALAWQQFGENLELTGLCTQHLFEPDAFTERLTVSSGVLQADRQGTGLGFDDLLLHLDWELLR